MEWHEIKAQREQVNKLENEIRELKGKKPIQYCYMCAKPAPEGFNNGWSKGKIVCGDCV